MNVDAALAVLRREVRKTSQRRLAKRLGISEATLSRWLSDKTTPEGETLEHLIAWAEQIPEPTPDEIMTAAVIATGDNLARLAEIRGYAQQVLTQLRQIAENQQQVVDSLDPWAKAEGRQIAVRMQQAALDDEETAQLRRQLDEASATVPTPPAKATAAPRRRATGQG